MTSSVASLVGKCTPTHPGLCHANISGPDDLLPHSHLPQGLALYSLALFQLPELESDQQPLEYLYKQHNIELLLCLIHRMPITSSQQHVKTEWLF